MKFSLLSLISLAITASATKDMRLPSSISATSSLGQSLLSSARRLEGKDDEESAYTWMTDYSLKFQGCRAHTTVNLEADGENDVIIQTVKMAHFRLCPSSSCTSRMGSGCSKNYADYIVDLETFSKSYIQSQRRAREYQCQLYMMASCDCQESDDRDDGFNREYCEYDCYANSKKYTDCVDRNPYEEEGEGKRQERFEPERYMECKELELESDDDDDADIKYYVGPYCSEKGKICVIAFVMIVCDIYLSCSNLLTKLLHCSLLLSNSLTGSDVYLGLYTDDTCTNFADSTNGRSTYKTLTSTELPYSTTSLINNDCVSCIEVEDLNRRQEEQQQQDDVYGDDAEDPDEVSEQCERLYESSGKCEGQLSSDLGIEANNNACSYIGGVQFTKSNGVVTKKVTAKDKANIFIGVFATAFVALGAVVYKLKKSVDAREVGDAPIEKKGSNDSKEKPLIGKEDLEETPVDASTSA